ncbi:MAG: ISKra4 family transposase [Planctomycetota bacterium]
MPATPAVTLGRAQNVQAPISQAACLLARHQFRSLEQWLYAGESQLMGLRSIELGEEGRGREILRLLLQAHIDGRGRGDVGPAIEVSRPEHPETTVLYRQKRARGRNILTIFGEVRVERARYASRRGDTNVYPLDEQLQLPHRSYSHELQRRVNKEAVQGPFDEAIESLREATGVRIPKRSAEDIVVEAGVDFESFYVCREVEHPEGSGPILVGSVDCKGIPMVKPQPAEKQVRRGKGQKANKKKMATVAAVYTQQPRVRTPEDVIKSLFDTDRERTKKSERFPGPERKRVWASLVAGKDAFIQDVKKEMDRRDPREAKNRVVVTDGERALQIRVCATMKGIRLILDFLHALEKLWICAHVFHPEGSSQAVGFVQERALRILRGGVSQVVKGLRQITTKRKLKGKKRKTLLNVAAYYYRNRSRMRYHEYLAEGLPIASGSVEGACKNLIKDRMERSGMRWTFTGAEAMVKMRAIYLSGDFDEYWDYHVDQEQARLYPKGLWRSTMVTSQVSGEKPQCS